MHLSFILILVPYACCEGNVSWGGGLEILAFTKHLFNIRHYIKCFHILVLILILQLKKLHLSDYKEYLPMFT